MSVRSEICYPTQMLGKETYYIFALLKKSEVKQTFS